MTILEVNLIVSDCADACAFYQRVFGANVRHLSNYPKGANEARVECAGLTMHLFEANPNIRIFPPDPQARKTMWWHLICDNVDEIYVRALREKCEAVEELRNLPDFGVRQGTVQDPFGYAWILTQNVRTAPPSATARALSGAAEKARLEQPAPQPEAPEEAD